MGIKKYFRFLIVIMINILSIIIFDLLFGYLGPRNYENLNKNWKINGEYDSNYRNYFVMSKENPRKFIVDKSTNHLWVRDNLEREDGKKRILFIGDSFTRGQGVKKKDAYPKKLEQITDKYMSFNRAISGSHILEVKNQLIQNIDEIAPHIIIYGYVLNDPIVETQSLITNLATDKKGVYKWDYINKRTHSIKRDRSQIFQFFYESSYILRYLIQSYELQEISKATKNYYQEIHDPEINKEGLRKTAQLIKEMNDLAQNKRAKFLVLVFPLLVSTEKDYPFLRAHQNFSNILKDNSIDVIDLYPVYKGIKAKELWVHPVDQHPNDYAHEIAAKKIKSYLE